jgi:hypothetical protein
MSSKTFLKIGVAFGILAIVLIFLGVNFVPRIFASSSSQGNVVVAINQSYILHTHYTNEQYQRAIALQVSGYQRHLMSNYVPSMAMIGFRTPPMSNYVPSMAVIGFRTPPMSNYAPSIAITGFRTPPMSDYMP